MAGGKRVRDAVFRAVGQARGEIGDTLTASVHQRQPQSERRVCPAMRLSVIIPAYNEASTITTVIELVRACGVPDLQLIIVDDCSTDGTGAILDALPPSPDLTILHHPVNR